MRHFANLIRNMLIWRSFQKPVHQIMYLCFLAPCSYFICPIAIAYGLGQIRNSVCLCHIVCPSVCPHSHGRISWSIFAKSGSEVTTPRSKNEFVGGNVAPPLLLCCLLPKNRHFGSKGPENPCNHKYANLCLKCSRISGIRVSYRKSRSRNTMVRLDFRPEVEIRQFRACALKDMQYNPYLWPHRQNLRSLRKWQCQS